VHPYKGKRGRRTAVVEVELTERSGSLPGIWGTISEANICSTYCIGGVLLAGVRLFAKTLVRGCTCREVTVGGMFQ
jgi:hypothetical protein